MEVVRVKKEEGEASEEDYPIDQGRDDELEQILQQTVPLGVQLNSAPKLPSKLSVNFTSIPPETQHSNNLKKRDHSPKRSVSVESSQKDKNDAKVLPLDALLKRDRPVRYFIIKCASNKNLAIALSKHIWSTQEHNEKKLREAYQDNEVILIFSVNKSGAFQGYARMVSGIGSKSSSIWEQTKKWGGLFYLEWICKKEVQFHKTNHLVNPLNDHKPVRVSRDGQELQKEVGYKLCKILDSGLKYDVNDIIITPSEETPVRTTITNKFNSNSGNMAVERNNKSIEEDNQEFDLDRSSSFSSSSSSISGSGKKVIETQRTTTKGTKIERYDPFLTATTSTLTTNLNFRVLQDLPQKQTIIQPVAYKPVVPENRFNITTCFTCGLEGHKSFECRQNGGRVDPRRVDLRTQVNGINEDLRDLRFNSTNHSNQNNSNNQNNRIQPTSTDLRSAIVNRSGEDLRKNGTKHLNQREKINNEPYQTKKSTTYYSLTRDSSSRSDTNSNNSYKSNNNHYQVQKKWSPPRDSYRYQIIQY